MLGIYLGQITAEGKSCEEIERLYTREKRLAKERSKASHRKRHAANVKRLDPAYQNCKEGGPQAVYPGPVDPLGTGPVSPLALQASQLPAPERGLNYGKVGGLALAGVVVVGGLIWFFSRGK
jgi:hypothetical protein